MSKAETDITVGTMAFDLPANGSGDRNVKSEAEQCVGLKSD
jgi:hypothetical protein